MVCVVVRAGFAARRQRVSKLDPFKATVAELLEQDAKASAMVIAQRQKLHCHPRQKTNSQRFTRIFRLPSKRRCVTPLSREIPAATP